LQSLDKTNKYIYEVGKTKIQKIAKEIAEFKSVLTQRGFSLVGNEPLKITLKSKPLGYTGAELNEHLKSKNIFCEFYDKDHVVFMFSSENTTDDLIVLKEALFNLERRSPIQVIPPKLLRKKVGMNCREAIFSPSETISVKDAVGRILSTVSVSCPPAIPIVVCGEIIDENAVENFNYYQIDKCIVVKK
jgi:arginine/lysine/ornithine decarboxylase